MSVRTLRYNTATQHFTKSARASTDRDALAFLEAAQIYNTNQQRAIVNLVRSLKRVGLWTKMKAIYPFVGGTASSHKWNLKDPRDLNVAGRLTFNGGWTHNANGITGNGSNTIALINRTPIDYVVNESSHLSIYNRLDITGPNATPDIGAYTTGQNQAHFIFIANTSNFYDIIAYQAPQNQIAAVNTTARYGFWVNTRTSTTSMKAFRNAVQVGATNTTTATGFATIQNTGYVIGSATNSGGGYTARGYAFATIGDGLTDTDASNLYNIVQRYQFQLGRAIEPDAQAFIDAAGITDATQQAAILDLVVRLKNDGLWSKMKAIYPFVGGTATSHKWNLKDPRDTNGAYRIAFNGGWTHNSNGITGNGSNSWADCNILPSALASGSSHISIYSRTNNAAAYFDISSYEVGTSYSHPIYIRNASNIGVFSAYKYPENNIEWTNTDSRGYYIHSRSSATVSKGFKNGSQIGGTDTNTALGFANLSKRYSIGTNQDAVYTTVSNRNYAFATIGDGLTDADATNLYNIVDLFQKRLGRAV